MDLSFKRKLGIFLILLTVSAIATAASAPPLVNWTAPATYKLGSSSKIHALTDISSPVPFIATAPCRQANSLLSTPLLQGVNRVVPLTGAPCNIPATAVAVSVNITVFNITGATGNGVFKVDTISPPLSAWINYPPTEVQRANAGAVALNGSGQIIVQVAQGAGQVDFIVDTNGYYGSTPATTTSPFIVNNAAGSGNAAIIGNNSSAAGNTFGVWGHITANPSGGNSAGVRGQVDGTGGGGIGVWGSHAGSGWGVLGFSAAGYGVFGSSGTNLGVLGVSSGSGISLAGVWGQSTDAIGTFGFSTNTNGMWAQSTNFDALAAFGGRDGGYLQGARNGVIGVSTATSGVTYGVDGFTASSASSAAGVRGFDPTGYNPAFPFGPSGVLGTSTNAFGVTGVSRFIGVYGALLSTSDSVVAQGFIASTFGTAADTTVGPWGVFSSGNFGATGAKHFVEPHPSDAKKVILYSSIEGRTVDTYFRGTARFVNHEAVIEVPEDFRIVTDEDGLTVQLTPVGGFASMYVESQDLNQIVVKSSKDVQFHYLIQGLRRAFKNFQPVQTGNEFMPTSQEARLPGYLTEEARRRLIENGTYNSDGTVNIATAERAGWAKIWADKAREAAEAAKAAKAQAQRVSVPKVPSQSQ